MFLGHYAVAYGLKAKYRKTPLWLLVLCVQLVDLLWAVLLFLGIERASYDPEASVFLRAIYTYYPYTHSLVSSVVIAFLVYLIFDRLSAGKWGKVAGIAVVSHWFLDFIVHVPDVPLFFNQYKVGLGLWQYPVATLMIELALLKLGWWYYYRHTEDKRMARWAAGASLFLAVFYLISFFVPPLAPSPVQVGVFGILIYGGVPAVLFAVERKRTTDMVQSKI